MDSSSIGPALVVLFVVGGTLYLTFDFLRWVKAQRVDPPPASRPPLRSPGKGTVDRGRVAWRRAWHLARLYGPSGCSVSNLRRSLEMCGYSPGYAWLLADRAEEAFYWRMYGPPARLVDEWRAMRHLSVRVVG